MNAGDAADGLAPLGPAAAAWFARAFGAPTPVQTRGWKAIAGGRDALLIAPTGSGKTLAAFLVAIDRLASEPERADADEGWRALYVSPLKALVYDVERNLGSPLAGIEVVARQLGLPFRPLTIDVRTGDTTAKERRRQIERPGDILVTTPESLYLLLTSSARRHLSQLRTLIIDEIHAIAPSKRGAHMMLSVERLSALVSGERAGEDSARAGLEPPSLQRIGLSATVRPAEQVARFLSGARACEIVDTAAPPRLDLQVIVPVEDMRRPHLGNGEEGETPALAPSPQERTSLWPAIEPRILELVLQHRSTIVFVNSRGLAERLAQRLNELAAELSEADGGGEPIGTAFVRAHHGSVAHAQRREMEEALKHGQLRGIVATSSLELGIDMGAVDLVIQVESPDSSARGLQRVGRAGHQVGGTSRGRIFPKHRNDLLEAAVVSRMMIDGHIEALSIPKNPLDVLAQQIVAMCAVGPWHRSELLALVRRSWSFRDLSEDVFDAVLEMLAGRFPSSDVADLRPRLNWDRAADRLEARNGARLLATVNGGTIPDRGLFGVFAAGDGDKPARVGELDEEMVHEARVGETFLLGASTWRIQEITRDRVIVTPAPGEPGKMPFWHGEGPGRPIETGRVLGAFVAHLAELGHEEADRWLALHYPLDRRARKNLIAHIAEQREATGLVPSDRTIVVERFKDEVGDFRVCILTPFGARVHAPWALALEEVLGQRSGVEVQALWTDDGIALRFADSDSGPDWDALWIEPDEIEERIVERLGTSAMFSGAFRENAARALLLPRRSPEGRSPLWQQRLRAQSLLAAVRQHAGFPIILETYRSCLQDQFDVPALRGVLEAITRRELRVHEVETRIASPFSRSLAFAYVAQYMYEYDNPVAERRAHALTLDRDLLRELLGEGELRSLLSDEVLAEVEDELQARVAPYKASDADRLHDLLRRLGALDEAEVGLRVESDGGAAALLAELERARRVVRLRIDGREQWAAIEDAALYRDGLGVAVPGGVPAVLLTRYDDALQALIMRYARSHGPFVADEVARHLGIPVTALGRELAALARAGKLSEGAYRPRGTSREWCEPEVLRRIRRRMLATLRKEVAAVDAATFARFLGEWHGLGAGRARGASGVVRLSEVVAQLEGLPIAVSELETRVLPARIRDYHPRLLDELMGQGEIVWVGAGALGTKDGRVCLYRRTQAAELLGAAVVPTGLTAVHEALLAQLAARGAQFFSEVLTRLDVTANNATVAEVTQALWDLVWMGLVTNDTLAPVRGFAAGKARAGTGSRALSAGGRWSLVGLLGAEQSPTRRRLARVTALFERWGLIGRGIVEAEGAFEGEGGFAGLYDTLRAMEDVGKVRRGHFIEGLAGTQLALPGVVDRLRAARAPGDGDALVLAACDPANPWGGLLPWPLPEAADASHPSSASLPKRKVGAVVVLSDGLPLLWVAPGGKKLVTLTSAREDERQAVRALTAWAATGREGQTMVTEIDGVPVRSTRWERLLREAGFGADYRGMVLSKRPALVTAPRFTPGFDRALAAIEQAPRSGPPAAKTGWPIGPWSTADELATSPEVEQDDAGRVRRFRFRSRRRT